MSEADAITDPTTDTTTDPAGVDAAEKRPTVVVSDGAVPERVAGAVEAEVDGERILLAPRDFSYFGLTGAAAAVWDGIDGTTAVGALIDRLEAQFEADPGQIREDTLQFLDALMAAGLIALPRDS